MPGSVDYGTTLRTEIYKSDGELGSPIHQVYQPAKKSLAFIVNKDQEQN